MLLAIKTRKLECGGLNKYFSLCIRNQKAGSHQHWFSSSVMSSSSQRPAWHWFCLPQGILFHPPAFPSWSWNSCSTPSTTSSPHSRQNEVEIPHKQSLMSKSFSRISSCSRIPFRFYWSELATRASWTSQRLGKWGKGCHKRLTPIMSHNLRLMPLFPKQIQSSVYNKVGGEGLWVSNESNLPHTVTTFALSIVFLSKRNECRIFPKCRSVRSLESQVYWGKYPKSDGLSKCGENPDVVNQVIAATTFVRIPSPTSSL